MGRLVIGGSGFEIYGDEADYSTYLNAQPRTSGWESLTTAVQQESIVAAARLLDRQRWRGSPTNPVQISFATTQPANTQGIQWPRTDVTDRNAVAVADSVIPDDILLAAYELASLLSESSPTVETETSERSVKLTEDMVGPIRTRIEYFGAAAGQGGRFPQQVQELVSHYLQAGASFVINNFGTDQSSSFSSDDYCVGGFGYK